MREFLEAQKMTYLRNLAKKYGIAAPYKYKKLELIDQLLDLPEDVQHQLLQETKAAGRALEEAQPRGRRGQHPRRQREESNAEVEAQSISLSHEEIKDANDRMDAPEGRAHCMIAARNRGAERWHRPLQSEDIAPANQENYESSDDQEDASHKVPLSTAVGVLEVHPDGYGFLHSTEDEKDYYVPNAHIRRFRLRSGDVLEGLVGDTHEDKDKYAPIIYLNQINGMSAIEFLKRDDFDELTPVYANEWLRLETKEDPAARIIDLVAPIGKGQRGLIVSPPKAGKTSLLKSIARAIEKNYPEINLFILLIDERPEEVTDFERSSNRWRSSEYDELTEFVASTFDKPPHNHVETAEELIERAKRLVESGKDVVILMDSLTRLSRAYNLTTAPSGRTLSGGLDPVALFPPKRFFGAARNIDGDGSLTIIATCLKDTGSRMDDMIYEEFKGTGNMEIQLSRSLAELRIFPAIDIFASGTRRDDLLHTRLEQQTMLSVRRQGRSSKRDEERVQTFIRLIENTQNNDEFCHLILHSMETEKEDKARDFEKKG